MYKSKLIKALDVLDKDYREAILNEDHDLILAIQNQQSAYMIALRLLDYEDLEEQGLLLRLPCKIGSEVWEIERQFWIDRKGCKDCIYFGNDGLGDYCDYDEDSPSACTKIVPKKFNIRMLDDFGKTIFLTKAEAEQKLKEMESD